MDFTWPELIRIKSWDGNEIKLVAFVEINKGQNDDAFDFEINTTQQEVQIRSYIKDYENLPKKILVMYDSEEVFFNTDDPKSALVKEFKEQKGINGFEYMTYGVIKDITLEVYVPENKALDVYSKFGMIEITGNHGNLIIHSKFGGVDLSTSGSTTIKAGTRFGEKYTNLDQPVTTLVLGTRHGKWDWVQLEGKGSPGIELKSDFGNIYIRKFM